MSNEDTQKSTEEDETCNEDFQFVLEKLLAVYRPIFEEGSKEAKGAKRSKDEAKEESPNCDDELSLANRLFEKFFTEEVAVRLLPEKGRALLGPINQWQWCFTHVRCCIIFGWLICRGPITFRKLIYYLYWYWLCVRRALGIAPKNNQLNTEERRDFAVLVKAFSTAYKPYLSNQLATLEFSESLPDEVLGGKIDCTEGDEDFSAIFERAMTMEAASALMGAEAFKKHRAEPFFWFCRCWCLCAIRFGCCLAKARSSKEIVRCLIDYWHCIRDCFKPLDCDLLEPTGCTDEEFNQSVGGMAVEVLGTAMGSSFDHYTLEWRKVEGGDCQDNADWQTDRVVYPGGGVIGNAPVNNSTLGWIDTTTFSAGSYEIRVCVYSTQGGVARKCCCIQFNLFKRLVWIDHVASHPVKTGPGFGPFNPDSPIVDPAPDAEPDASNVVPVGCCVYVRGSAFVGECNNRKIKCFDLRYGIGFLPGANQAGFNPASYSGSLLPTPVCYTPPDEADKRAPWNQVIGRNLTTQFKETVIDLFGNPITVWKLHDFCFNSDGGLLACADAQHTCHSGQYTLLLDVEDTLGNHYYDTQHVWFDNKPIHAEFMGLDGVKGCEDVDLGKFVPSGRPCTTPWPMKLNGIAYDELIDPAIFTYPSDNFDYYRLRITRQGGPTYQVPITPSLTPPAFDPVLGEFRRRQRVGEPGTRCEENIPGCPIPPHPGKSPGILTELDLRIFDADCVSSLAFPFSPPPGFALERGECCGYTFQLYVQDRTRSNSSNCHWKWSLPWAVCICNPKDNTEDDDQ